jgi:hypothetical protein
VEVEWEPVPASVLVSVLGSERVSVSVSVPE